MKPQKLLELLASISSAPIGCLRTNRSGEGRWHGLTTKEADAIRNALAKLIRRKERKSTRIDSAGSREQYSEALCAIARDLGLPGSATLHTDVPNAVRQMVERLDGLREGAAKIEANYTAQVAEFNAQQAEHDAAQEVESVTVAIDG